MAEIKVSKSELTSEANKLSEAIKSLESVKDSLMSTLESVSDYDGITISAAGQTLASNIENVLNDIKIAGTNILNYASSIEALDTPASTSSNMESSSDGNSATPTAASSSSQSIVEESPSVKDTTIEATSEPSTPITLSYSYNSGNSDTDITPVSTSSSSGSIQSSGSNSGMTISYASSTDTGSSESSDSDSGMTINLAKDKNKAPSEDLDKYEDLVFKEGDIYTPSSWIKNSQQPQTNIVINTADGKKEFSIFEQRTFNQWSNGGWNLSNNGCAVCTTTTIIRAYGDKKWQNATPGDIINNAHGGVPFNFFGDGIKDSLTKCGVKYKYQNFGNGDLGKMMKLLKSGYPMIVSVRGNGQFFAHSSGHTIALLGVTKEGRVIIGDSYCAFHGSTTYTMDPRDIFSVMCNDPCNSYDSKEVLVIGQ